jgi:hypothetical protein
MRTLTYRGGGAFRSSSPTLWRYPYALKCYIVGIPLGPLVLCYENQLECHSGVY